MFLAVILLRRINVKDKPMAPNVRAYPPFCAPERFGEGLARLLQHIKACNNRVKAKWPPEGGEAHRMVRVGVKRCSAP